MQMQAPSTADKILAASNMLFYSQGLRVVSMDQVAHAAGLTKRTLYYHFKSKDALIEAWLTWRTEQSRAEMAAIQGQPLERIRTAFAQLGIQVLHPLFRGCPFVNAVAELADFKHPAVAVAQLYKADRLVWFEAIIDELGKPQSYAATLMTLWEGTIARAIIDRSGAPVRQACDAVELLLKG
jgi:AcrR family transcriptional regulator